MIIRRFDPSDVPAVDRFNLRLRAGGAAWPVYVEGAPKPPGPLTARMFVAADEGEVRGAVWLHEQTFEVDGTAVAGGWAKYPVGESLVDERFAGVPSALLIKLMREQPRLMALGMGGLDGQFARLLRSMRWRGFEVPFFARLIRPSRVLRGLTALRTTAARRRLLDMLAVSGLGWLGWRVSQAILRSRLPRTGALTVTIEQSFGEWADTIWDRARGSVSFVGRRDAAMLNVMYPTTMPVERLRIRRGAEELGWVVVLRRDLTERPTTAFGPLKVGLIADGFALPGDVAALVSVADAHLAAADVDLIFTNQSHEAWWSALRACGYLRGPSQFAFFASPKMADPFGDPARTARAHINRGDCDGPLFA